MNKIQNKLFTIWALFMTAALVAEPMTLQEKKAALEYLDQSIKLTTNPYTVKLAIDAKEKNSVIIDVRTEEDYKKGHIPEAVNFPFDQRKDFENPEQLIPLLTEETIIYIYCYNDFCHLAKIAAKKFISLGYKVKEMRGGFQAWSDYGYSIVQ